MFQEWSKVFAFEFLKSLFILSWTLSLYLQIIKLLLLLTLSHFMWAYSTNNDPLKNSDRVWHQLLGAKFKPNFYRWRNGAYGTIRRETWTNMCARCRFLLSCHFASPPLLVGLVLCKHSKKYFLAPTSADVLFHPRFKNFWGGGMKGCLSARKATS